MVLPEFWATTFCGGLVVPPGLVVPMNTWLWIGIWLVVSVTVSTPPDWPMMYVWPSGPVPWCNGTRPRRSGRLKVVWPSPPYVVPISTKRVSFSAIDIVDPSQNAQPFGGKFPPNIRISPTYGCATATSSVLGREDALQGHAERDRQKRLPVLVWLAAADVADRGRVEGGQAARVRRPVLVVCRGEVVARRDGRVGARRRSLSDVCVLGHRGLGDRHGGRAGRFALCEPVPEVDRHLSSQVRDRERRLTVAPVHRPEEREERLVLVDRQGLAVGQRPPFRGEVEGHHPDLA